MARATPARRVALSLLSECRRRQARARDLLRGSDALSALPERDRALATRLVLGSVAASGELDRVIDGCLSRRAHLEPRVRDALRLAAFEALYLETPDATCVSQGVELVRGVAPRAAGLANAVLRRVAEEGTRELADARARLASGDFGAPELARVGGLPEWLCERALASLGPARSSAWAQAALGPAGAWAAANRALVSPGEALRLLGEAGCEPEEGPLAGSLWLARPARLAPSGLVESVHVLPCDVAAQEVALVAAPAPDERVLEVGQGRGTKTLLLEGAAIAAGGACELVAVEADAAKSAEAARRVRTSGLEGHVSCEVADGRALDASLGTFDLAFVDAPCTGTGTLARHPEIAWSLGRDATGGLSRLQGELLAAAAARVGAAGRLVYATCSILAEENEDVVRGFLGSRAGAGFELVRAGRTDLPRADTHFHAELRRRA